MGLRLPLLLWRRHHTLRKTRKIASRMAAQNASLFMVAFIGVELDFTGISYTTQAFMHELLGELICEFGEWVYDYITYKGANRNVFRAILKSYETMPQKPKSIYYD